MNVFGKNVLKSNVQKQSRVINIYNESLQKPLNNFATQQSHNYLQDQESFDLEYAAQNQEMFKNPENMRQPCVLKDLIIGSESIRVKQLARLIKEEMTVLQEKLGVYGLQNESDSVLNLKECQLVLYEYGFRVLKGKAKLKERQPVVSIMGHVDHGKTTLLDKMRQSELAIGEAGGITQRIGAFSVEKDGQKMTFLDTPGHEAFNQMRDRGGLCTDIIVLVVSATDGVQEQTKEVVEIARRHGNTLIVVINKIDVLGCRPLEDVEEELFDKARIDIEPKGGNVPVLHVSAKYGKNIDLLQELILFETELRELKGNFEMAAEGRVIESRSLKKKMGEEGLDSGKGCTLLIQRGVLMLNDWVLIGNEPFKVRRMTDDRQVELNQAQLSQAVEIIGLKELPQSGERFFAVNNEMEAKLVGRRLQETKKLTEEEGGQKDYLNIKSSKVKFRNWRDKRNFYSGNKQYQKDKYQEVEDKYIEEIEQLEGKIRNRQQQVEEERDEDLRKSHQRKLEKLEETLEKKESLLEEHYKNMEGFISEHLKGKDEKKEKREGVRVYIKTADKGTLETVCASMVKVAGGNDTTSVQLVGQEVGEIGPQDVRQAILHDAVIMAMNVELTPEAFLIAKDNQLQVKTTKIIYELLDDLQHIIDDYNNVGKMQYEQKGQARVKMIYNVKTKLGYMNIAGCSVQKGRMARKLKAKVIRDGVTLITDCSIQQLKHFKDDVQEVNKGNDCGIALNEFDEFLPNDLIEVYEEKPFQKMFNPLQYD